MAEPAPFRRLAVTRSGAIAREVLAEAGEIRVLAVFERTFYLACPHGIVCIGPPDLVAGPINVGAQAIDHNPWSGPAVAIDDEGEIADGLAMIGDTLSIDVAGGATWHPSPFPAFDPNIAQQGISALRRAVGPAAPEEGLASLIFGATGHAPRALSPARAASAPITQLRDTLPEVLRMDRWSAAALRGATLLIGLGPGLTPSGDDIVGGLMLALTAAGRDGLRDDLWHALAPELDALTSPPSAMHLSAAADGMAAAPVHDLLGDILTGGTPDMPARLAAVADLGHTSGWDICAGAVLGLEAVVSAVR